MVGCRVLDECLKSSSLFSWRGLGDCRWHWWQRGHSRSRTSCGVLKGWSKRRHGGVGPSFLLVLVVEGGASPKFMLEYMRLYPAQWVAGTPGAGLIRVR